MAFNTKDVSLHTVVPGPHDNLETQTIAFASKFSRVSAASVTSQIAFTSKFSRLSAASVTSQVKAVFAGHSRVTQMTLLGERDAASDQRPNCARIVWNFIVSQWTFLLSTLPKALIAQVLLLVAWNVGVLYLHQHMEGLHEVPLEWQHLTAAAKTVLQLMSFFVGFLIIYHKQTAYSRWWEARCLWGGTVKSAIEVTQLACVCIQDKYLAERIVRHTIVFCFAAKQLLRKEPLNWEELKGAISDDEFAAIQKVEGWSALYSLDVCRMCFQKAVQNQPVSAQSIMQSQAFETNVSALWGYLGGCLRIAYTPIPASQEGFIVTVTWFYLLLLPFSTVAEIGEYVILVASLMTWLMAGIHNAAAQIQEPFGDDPDDLPLKSYCECVRLQCCSIFLRLHDNRDLVHGWPTASEHGNLQAMAEEFIANVPQPFSETTSSSTE